MAMGADIKLSTRKHLKRDRFRFKHFGWTEEIKTQLIFTNSNCQHVGKKLGSTDTSNTKLGHLGHMLGYLGMALPCTILEFVERRCDMPVSACPYPCNKVKGIYANKSLKKSHGK